MEEARATSDYLSITNLGLAWLRDPKSNGVGLEGHLQLLQYKLTSNPTLKGQITLPSRAL